MSITIHLPISHFAKVMVCQGDHITANTTLAKLIESFESETIHLAKLLSVPNSNISKYLKKKIGEKIEAGEVIAEKKGFLSSSYVKSPINGKLEQLDLSAGTLSLLKYSKEGKKEFLSPVSGKVVSIGKSSIEIEVKNPVFTAVKGEGNETIGNLCFLDKDEIGVLDMQNEVDDSIVIGRSFTEVALLKLSVIGGLGVITIKIKKDISFPWVQVEENVFDKLTDFAGQQVWLKPEDKQIVILD